MKRKARRTSGQTSARPMWEHDQDTSMTGLMAEMERDFLASVERLRAAGLIESIEHDSGTGTGVITFTEASHQLMLTGRHIFEEPAFLRVWRTHDPDKVRRWVESEAARLSSERLPDIDTNEAPSEPQPRSRTR